MKDRGRQLRLRYFSRARCSLVRRPFLQRSGRRIAMASASTLAVNTLLTILYDAKTRPVSWRFIFSGVCSNSSTVETNVQVMAQCNVAQNFPSLLAHAFPDAGVITSVNQGRRPRGYFTFLVIALAEWALWRNRCISKVRQRCQRSTRSLLWRLQRELVTFFGCQLLVLGECESLWR